MNWTTQEMSKQKPNLFCPTGKKLEKIVLLYGSVIPLYRNLRTFPFQRHKDLIGDSKKASKYPVKGIQDS